MKSIAIIIIATIGFVSPAVAVAQEAPIAPHWVNVPLPPQRPITMTRNITKAHKTTVSRDEGIVLSAGTGF